MPNPSFDHIAGTDSISRAMRKRAEERRAENAISDKEFLRAVQTIAYSQHVPQHERHEIYMLYASLAQIARAITELTQTERNSANV